LFQAIRTSTPRAPTANSVGAQALDLPISQAKQPSQIHPFKGNMDTEQLAQAIEREGAKKIPLVMLTVTNNSGGGQPVSMANIRDVKQICKKQRHSSLY